MKRFLRLLGNALWFLFCGLELFIGELIACVISIVTIIPLLLGIPKVHLVTAKYVIFPFGKSVKTNFFAAPVRNIVNFIFGGFITGVFAILLGIVFCITIVGIPLGKIMFNMARLSIAPFKASIQKK